MNIGEKNKTFLPDIEMEKECARLTKLNTIMLDFVYLAAASKRRDGEYSNSRELLEQKAKAVLDIIES